MNELDWKTFSIELVVLRTASELFLSRRKKPIWTWPKIDTNTLLRSQSSSTAFHTLISVAMLPYNQSFSFVCLFLFVFPLLRVRCVKRKEKKVEEKGGHFTVGERG